MQDRKPTLILSPVLFFCLLAFSPETVRTQQAPAGGRTEVIVERETVAPEQAGGPPTQEDPEGESLSKAAESASECSAPPGRPETDETSPADQDQMSSKDKPADSAESPEEDRRWIIKTPAAVERKSPEKQNQTLKTFEWKNDEQRTKCSGYLQELSSVYLRTRYASIKGDSCATAVHAEETLKLMEQCRNECPPGYLERTGYSKRIERNVKLLQTAGKRRCLGYGDKEPPTE